MTPTAPATHDLASISIHPPGGTPIQRVSWWEKAKGAGSLLARTGVTGGLAAAGAAAVGSAALPAALVGGGAYLGYRALDWALSPSAAPEEARLKLPSTRLKERPDKPDSLKGQKDEFDNPLTAHHKIPFNQIRDTINDASGSSWSSLIPGRQARARKNLAIWGARQGKEEVGPAALTWTRHNLFMGTLEEHRADDPKEKLDTHFTESGTATPRSELALDITHKGGLSKVDPEVLRKRLQALADKQASDYKKSEWQGPADDRTQKGQPKDWAAKTTAQKVQAVADRRKRKRGKKGK